ncbi:MAG: hypothetical protein ABI870_14190 [Rhodanobacter sp.]
MNQPDPSPSPAADPDQMPRHTTPTWEVELLISGVAVFAMLQLPGWLDDRFFALLPRFDTDWASLLQLMYMYLKSAAVILAVTFALHLSLRAHWIALVGMHSVFPGGVRWENQRMGPVQRALEQRRHGSAESAIERADNRATVVFAIGVALATFLLILSAVVISAFLLAMLYAWLTGMHTQIGILMLGCTAVIIFPFSVFIAIDRVYGDRLLPDGAARRRLAAAIEFFGRLGLGRRSGVMALLSSRGGKRNQGLFFGLFFFGLITIVMLQMETLKSPWRLGSFQLFPRTIDGDRSISSAYYDDQRDPVHDPASPYMQSAVITGPYLQLMVPYQPTRDVPALRKACPAALNISDDAARTVATLDCLTRLHAVMLDGAPLAPLHYDAGNDPRTERPALQAMIDVRALTPGRHELRVMRAPAAAGDVDRHDQAAQYVIPFWH